MENSLTNELNRHKDSEYQVFRDSEETLNNTNYDIENPLKDSQKIIDEQENKIKPILKNIKFGSNRNVSFVDESGYFGWFYCLCNRYNISIVLVTSVITAVILVLIYFFLLKKNYEN